MPIFGSFFMVGPHMHSVKNLHPGYVSLPDITPGARKNVFKQSKLGKITIAAIPNVIADFKAVINSRATLDRKIIANAILLPDNHVGSGIQIIPDANIRIDYRSRADARAFFPITVLRKGIPLPDLFPKIVTLSHFEPGLK
jgi:hypothetical protein